MTKAIAFSLTSSFVLFLFLIFSSKSCASFLYVSFFTPVSLANLLLGSTTRRHMISSPSSMSSSMSHSMAS